MLRIGGKVSSTSTVTVPGKAGKLAKGLGLTGRFLYLEARAAAAAAAGARPRRRPAARRQPPVAHRSPLPLAASLPPPLAERDPIAAAP